MTRTALSPRYVRWQLVAYSPFAVSLDTSTAPCLGDSKWAERVSTAVQRGRPLTCGSEGVAPMSYPYHPSRIKDTRIPVSAHELVADPCWQLKVVTHWHAASAMLDLANIPEQPHVRSPSQRSIFFLNDFKSIANALQSRFKPQSDI